MTETKTVLDLQQLARDIAQELGPKDWTYKQPHENYDRREHAEIAGPRQAEIHITCSRYQKNDPPRLGISGVYPWPLSSYLPYERPSVDITVSSAKPAAVIAKAIATRLLPAYLAVLTETQAKKAQADDATARADQHAAELAHALGVTDYQHARNFQETGARDARLTYNAGARQGHYDPSLSIEATVSSYKDRDTFKIEARHDIALQIAAFIASLKIEAPE